MVTEGGVTSNSWAMSVMVTSPARLPMHSSMCISLSVRLLLLKWRSMTSSTLSTER